MSGWIKISRTIQDHWIFENQKWFKWWCTILLQVNHSDAEKLFNGSILNIKAGQSIKSLRTWGLLFDCTPKTAGKFFDLLSENDMIIKERIGTSKRSSTFITVVNWSKYQTGDDMVTKARKTSVAQKSIDERESDFKLSLSPFLDSYGKVILNEFYLYWTEKAQRGKKMRFEKQATFDISRRLMRWKNSNFNKNGGTKASGKSFDESNENLLGAIDS